MSWTTEIVPRIPWTGETPAGADWVSPVPPYAVWKASNPGDQFRITEDGALRITEDGRAVRILERLRVTWNNETPLYNVWT